MLLLCHDETYMKDYAMYLASDPLHSRVVEASVDFYVIISVT